MARGLTTTTSFEILGVDPSASAEEIKGQYRALCRITHPDHGGSAALFRLVNDAYADVTNAARNGGSSVPLASATRSTPYVGGRRRRAA